MNAKTRSFLHKITYGRLYPHDLQGGCCGICGATFYYPGWTVPEGGLWLNTNQTSLYPYQPHDSSTTPGSFGGSPKSIL